MGRRLSSTIAKLIQRQFEKSYNKRTPGRIESLESREMLDATPFVNYNLATNGSFEIGFDESDKGTYVGQEQVIGWQTPDGNLLNLQGKKTDGKISVALDASADKQDRIIQTLQTRAGEEYLVTFNLRGVGAASSNEVRVIWNGIAIGTFVGGQEWQRLSVLAKNTVDGVSSLEFREINQSGAEGGDGKGILLDDIRIFDVDSRRKLNGSFESGIEDGKTAYRSEDVPGWSSLRRFDGDNKIRIRKGGANVPSGEHYVLLDANPKQQDGIVANVTTFGGQDYVLTFDTRTDASQSSLDNQIRVRWNNEHVGSVYASNDWQSVSVFLPSSGVEKTRLVIREIVENAAGNGAWIDNVRLSAVNPIEATVAEITPHDGTGSVNVNREATIRFSNPINPYTIDTESIKVYSRSQEVSGELRVSKTNQTVTFYPDQPWADSSSIRVQVDGSKIEDMQGRPIDANNDGTFGNVGKSDFQTLSLTFIKDTVVTGKVFQSNQVDINGDNIPVVGATIYLEGRPDIFATTNENGEFTLTSPEGLPAPDFFVVIDGSTATGVPDGFMYPTLGKPFHSIPGQTAPLKDGAGKKFAIFLPLMDKSDIVSLSETDSTEVGFGNGGKQTLAELFPNVDPSVWDRANVVIAPGSAQNDQGESATQAAVIPVAPDRIPAPLPEFLNPELVISVQAGGVGGFNSAGGATNFDVPAEVTFPNLEGLAPGEKSLILSFDHDAGEWVVIGSGTVSDDGLVIVSDGGVIRAPGWHFTISGSLPTVTPGVDNSDRDTGSKRYREFSATDPGLILTAGANLAVFFIQDFMRDQGSELGAAHLAHFAGGTGTPLNYENGSDVSNKVKLSGEFNEQNIFIQNHIKNELDKAVASGNTNGVQIPLSEADLNRAKGRIAFSDPELFWAMNGTQGLDITSNIKLEGDRYVGTVTYTYHDDYGFGIDDTHFGKNKLTKRAKDANTLMRHLQLSGSAKWFPVSVTVEVPFNQPAPPPPSPLNAPLEFFLFANNQGASPVSTEPGFGTSDDIYYRFIMSSGAEVAGKVTGNSGIANVVLPPNEVYRGVFYAPASNTSASIHGRSGQSGSPFAFQSDVPQVSLDDFGGFDVDRDGIPDIGEIAIGTNFEKADTDDDGVNDGAELAQGLDPLSGIIAATGVVGSLDIGSPLEAVDSLGDTTYVITGRKLTAIDTTQYNQPIILGEVPFSTDAKDIAVDRERQVAIVTAGLSTHIVDVSDPMMPTVDRTVSVFADKVELFAGFAYLIAGSKISTMDIETGEIVDQQNIDGGGNITGMARKGDKLFAFLSGPDNLVSFDLSRPEAPQLLDSLQVPVASFDVGLFAGNDVLWLAGSGLRTVDTTDPADLKIIKTPGDGDFFTASEIVLNGSGLGLLLPDGGNFIQVYDTSDPDNVANLLTQFNLQGRAKDLKISGGIAYVAAGNRLEIVNAQPFDTLGQAPTVTINSPTMDVDPNTEGIQVFEGTTLTVEADVIDDVQVRQVDLLVNGNIVSQDVSFPFDLTTIAPILSGGPESLSLQVRATDTGGNAALSNEIIVDVIPDTIAPTIVSVTPADRAEIPEGDRTIRVRFDESLDESSIGDDTFQVIHAGADKVFGTDDDSVVDSNVLLRDDGRLVQIQANELELGNIRLVIDEQQILDRAGNSMGNGKFRANYKVVEVAPVFQGNNPDVVFVIDVSGSTGGQFGGTPVGDVNGDGRSNTILDAQLASLIVLNQELVNLGHGNTTNISIVTFNSGAIIKDMDLDISGSQRATTPLADTNNNGIRDVEEILSTILGGGGTNFESALNASLTVFDELGTANGDGNLIFLSDGSDGTDIADEVAALDAKNVKRLAFGVGSGASLTKLQQIDPDAERVLSTDEFIDAILGL